MPKEYPRSQRVGDQLQRELAELVQREIKDPRVRMVSITAVRVSRDMSHARVFVTTLDDEHRDDVVKALNHAAGFLRHELGARLHLRSIPALQFLYDESVEHGMYMDKLIDEGLARGVADDSGNDSSGEND